MSSNRMRAEAGLAEIFAAVKAEVSAAGAVGLRNDEVARALGLESSVNGGQRNHLTHAILNSLVENGVLARRKEGARVYYSQAT